jgi:hypothetical protein
VFSLSFLVVLVPIDAGLLPFDREQLDQLWTDYLLPEPFLLEKLEVLESRAGISKISHIRRLAPILQIFEVFDESWLREQLLGREVV